MDDLTKLTEEQASIISSDATLKRVIACAGSGKTRVITASIIKLIGEKKVRPGGILALTFTRNAAENMRRRISENFKNKYDFENMDIHTFNSFGNEIISENSFELGLGKNYKLISATRSWQILYEIFSDFHFNYLEVGKNTGKFVQDLLAYIEYLKNNLVTVGDFRKYMENREAILSAYKSKALRSQEEELADRQKELFEIYLRYEDIKTARSFIDYADQVFLPFYLLLERSSIRARYQSRYRYIFVDEFQDTNIAQAHLLSLLFKAGENNMTVVGDDDQGIYSFRGACIDNILDFHNWDVFRDTVTTDFYLTGNFRSGDNIVEAAGRLISHNSTRFKKKIYSSRKDRRSEVAFFARKTLQQEAEQVAETIEWMAEKGIRLKDIAIISRRKRFDPFAVELEKRNIRYELIGGKNYLSEPEIMFLISWLRLICDTGDELSAACLLGSAKYRIGDRDISFINKGCSYPEKSGRNFIEALYGARNNPYISSEARERIKAFIGALRLYIRRSHEFRLHELVSFIFEESGLSYHLRSGFGWGARNSIRNVEKLIRIATDFEQDTGGNEGLQSFITYLEDVAGTDPDLLGQAGDSRGDSVRIMSIHAAKGLEFRVVFLPMLWKDDYSGRDTGKSSSIIPAELRKDGMVWGQKKDFPSEKAFRQALGKIKDEEERRIFYVACSRAKEILVLSHSGQEAIREEASGSERKKEIVPYFYELAGDSSGRIRILNREALEYFKDRGGRDKRVEDYRNIFNFAAAGRPAKRSRMPSFDWSGAERELYFQIKKDRWPGLSGFEKKLKSIAGEIKPGGDMITDMKGNPKKTPGFYSLTALLDYMKCSILYKWRYVFQIPGLADELLSMGDAMHRYIERITGFKYTCPDAGGAAIQGMIKDFPLKEHLEKFCESRFLHFEGLKEFRLEQLFYWKLDSCFITGKFDRVDFPENGKVEIIDYKLSRGGIKKQVNERYRSQLIAYTAAVSDIYDVPLQKISATLYYLKENEEGSLAFSEKELKDLKCKLLDSINKIENNDFRSPAPAGCGKKCPYYRLCFNDMTFPDKKP